MQSRRCSFSEVTQQAKMCLVPSSACSDFIAEHFYFFFCVCVCVSACVFQIASTPAMLTATIWCTWAAGGMEN